MRPATSCGRLFDHTHFTCNENLRRPDADNLASLRALMFSKHELLGELRWCQGNCLSTANVASPKSQNCSFCGDCLVYLLLRRTKCSGRSQRSDARSSAALLCPSTSHCLTCGKVLVESQPWVVDRRHPGRSSKRAELLLVSKTCSDVRPQSLLSALVLRNKGTSGIERTSIHRVTELPDLRLSL